MMSSHGNSVHFSSSIFDGSTVVPPPNLKKLPIFYMKLGGVSLPSVPEAWLYTVGIEPAYSCISGSISTKFF